MKKALWVFAICFTLGIMLAGSDGKYFPYINMLGITIFSGCFPAGCAIKEAEKTKRYPELY